MKFYEMSDSAKVESLRDFLGTNKDDTTLSIFGTLSKSAKLDAAEETYKVSNAFKAFVDEDYYTKTLAQLLKEDGLKGSDYGIEVKDGCTTLRVSPRYLEGGWDNVLNSYAIRTGVGTYKTKDKDSDEKEA